MVAAMQKDKSVCVSQLLKGVEVLQAILWVKQAWNDVAAETISKCFQMCGFDQRNDGTCTLYIYLFLCFTNFPVLAVFRSIFIKEAFDFI